MKLKPSLMRDPSNARAEDKHSCAETTLTFTYRFANWHDKSARVPHNGTTNRILHTFKLHQIIIITQNSDKAPACCNIVF